jgi:hypothetical protein
MTQNDADQNERKKVLKTKLLAFRTKGFVVKEKSGRRVGLRLVGVGGDQFCLSNAFLA